MPRLHLIVRGRVQGVGFRAALYDFALTAGVKGWVSNRRDGAVECVAEGPPDALAELRTFCTLGPPGAGVTAVDEITETETGEFDRFHVYPTRWA